MPKATRRYDPQRELPHEIPVAASELAKASSITTAWDEHSFPLHSRNPRNNCSANAEHPCQHHQRYLKTGTRAAQVINRHTDRSRLKLGDPRGVWFTGLHRIPPSGDFNRRLTRDWTGQPHQVVETTATSPDLNCQANTAVSRSPSGLTRPNRRSELNGRTRWSRQLRLLPTSMDGRTQQYPDPPAE